MISLKKGGLTKFAMTKEKSEKSTLKSEKFAQIIENFACGAIIFVAATNRFALCRYPHRCPAVGCPIGQHRLAWPNLDCYGLQIEGNKFHFSEPRPNGGGEPFSRQIYTGCPS